VITNPSTAAGAVRVAPKSTLRPAGERAGPDVLFLPRPTGPAARFGRALDGRNPAVGAAVVTVGAYALLTAGMVAIGMLLTKAVFDGTSGWDADVNRWFEARRTGTWDDLTRYGSHVADTLTVVGLAAVVIAILACRKYWHEITFLALALALEVTVFVSTTFLIDRERPPVARLDDSPPTSSFPSGHTAASVVLYAGLALIVTARFRSPLVRAVAWCIAVLAPVSVAIARLYRGMHYPSDVLVGVLLGLACIAAALLAVRTAASMSRRREDVIT
jgi:membrane-associated phospholipid phosphatase